jgi:hypothetical protein
MDSYHRVGRVAFSPFIGLEKKNQPLQIIRDQSTALSNSKKPEKDPL